MGMAGLVLALMVWILSGIDVAEAERLALKVFPGEVVDVQDVVDIGDGCYDDATFYKVRIQGAAYRSDVYVNRETGMVSRYSHDYDTDDNRENLPVPSVANEMLLEEEAARIALKAVPGEIALMEWNEDVGSAYYGFYIRGFRGDYEVYINAHTGKVIELNKV